MTALIRYPNQPGSASPLTNSPKSLAKPQLSKVLRAHEDFDEPPLMPADDMAGLDLDDTCDLHYTAAAEREVEGGGGGGGSQVRAQTGGQGASGARNYSTAMLMPQRAAGPNYDLLPTSVDAHIESLQGRGAVGTADGYGRGHPPRSAVAPIGQRTRVAAPGSARSLRTTGTVGSPTSLSAYAYPSAATIASLTGADGASRGRSLGAGRLAASLRPHANTHPTLPRPGNEAANAVALVVDEGHNKLQSHNGKGGVALDAPIHPANRVGGPVARVPRDNDELVHSDSDMLAFSRKPRRVAYQPASSAKALRGDSSAVMGSFLPTHSYSGLGAAPDTAELAMRRAGVERAKSYAESVNAAARAAAEKSAAALLAAPQMAAFPPPPLPPSIVGQRKGPLADAALAAAAVRERALEYSRKINAKVSAASTEGGGGGTSPPGGGTGGYAARRAEREVVAGHVVSSRGAPLLPRRPSPLRAPEALRRRGGTTDDAVAANAASSLIEMEELHERRRAEADAIRREMLA